MEKKRTSIWLPCELHFQLKQFCAEISYERGKAITMGEIIEKSVKAYLARHNTKKNRKTMAK